MNYLESSPRGEIGINRWTGPVNGYSRTSRASVRIDIVLGKPPHNASVVCGFKAETCSGDPRILSSNVVRATHVNRLGSSPVESAP